MVQSFWMKKAFAISAIALVLSMTLCVSQVAQAADTTQVPASQRCSASGGASSTFGNESVELCGTVAPDPTHNNLYKFNAVVTDIQTINDPESGGVDNSYYDRTADFTYSWTVMSGSTVAQKMNNNNPTFYDGLATLATGNYQVVLIATAQQNNHGIPVGSTILTTNNIPLSISTGTSAGTLATITSVKATGQIDPNTKKSSYEMIAQLTGANGCIESGGSQGTGTPCIDNNNSAPNNNGYTWTWTAKYAVGSNAGQSYPLDKSVGFDVINSFDPGSYYLQATATPANGSPVSTNTSTDPNATLNAGSLNGNTLSIACTRNGTTGVSYQCVATPSIANGQSAAYNFAWTVNGTALAANGFNVPVTFVAGHVNTVSVVMKSNTDGSTTAQNISYTLDASGATSATNGNTSVTASPDACSISAAGVTCIVGKVIGSVLGFITNMMTWLVAHLLLPITENVLSISPHTSTFSAVIIQEWVFIRNFCNIFFIATLIMLGIGTLLNVGPNDPKKILPKLVISALLINFSLAISQAILGVADVFQAQFLGMCTAATTASCQSTVVLENLAYRLMIAPLVHITAGAATSITGLSVALVTEVVYFLIAIMAMFVFAALTAYLVIRIVALWLLLMTSPIAFATWFVPNKTIGGLGSAWWSNFLKYAFFTPIIALCLHICALLANAQSTFTQGSLTNQLANQVASGTGNLQTAATDILTAFLVAACLGAALSLASKMGIKGADTVMKSYKSVQERVFGAPTGAAAWAANYAGARTMREIREKSYGLVNDKDGNVRTGFRGALGRTINAAVNPDAMMKSMKTNFEAKNKAALEQSQALSNRLQYRNQTGIDNKADNVLLDKRNDEQVSKFMSIMSREELKSTYETTKDQRLKILLQTARLQKGYLKRDLQKDENDRAAAAGVPPQNIGDVDIATHLASNMTTMSPEAAKLWSKNISKFGKEKFQPAFIGINDPAQNAKITEWMDSLSPEEMAKMNTELFKTKPALGDAFARAVNKMGESAANPISINQLSNLNTASVDLILDKKDSESLMKLPLVRKPDGSTDNLIVTTAQAIARRSQTEGSDFADKMSKQKLDTLKDIGGFANPTANTAALEIAKSMSNGSLSKFYGRYTNVPGQPAVTIPAMDTAMRTLLKERVVQNGKFAEEISSKVLASYNNADKAQMLNSMNTETASKQDIAFYGANPGLITAMKNKIDADPAKAEKISQSLLTHIHNAAPLSPGAVTYLTSKGFTL
jgi:hypothetical protein